MKTIESLEKAIGRKFTASELLHTKVIPIPKGGVIRTVSGPLASVLQIDYAGVPLHHLKTQVEIALQALEQIAGEAYEGRDIQVHQGGSHLDVIDYGVGSTGWLIVADHLQ